MQRRRFLALAGATLGAGCSGLLREENEQSTETVTPVPVGSVGGDESGPRDADAEEREPPSIDGEQVVDLETGPRTLAIPGRRYDDDYDAVVLHAPDGGRVRVAFTDTATRDHPATVTATLVNDNDWGNRFHLSEVPVFAGVNYAELHRDEFNRRFDADTYDRQTGLYLAPTHNHELVDESPAITRGPEGYWQVNPFPTELPEHVTLGAGDFVTGEYYVLGHWDRVGFPTGTYDFDQAGDGFRLAAWDATAAGPPADSRFDEPAAPLPYHEDTPWYHEAGDDTPIYLRPEEERIRPPARVSFRLVNHTREWLSGNPYFGALYKRVDDEWHEAVPREIPTPAADLAPGESHGYALSLFHESGFDADDEAADLSKTVDRIGGGRYAFASGFSADGADAPAAMFDVVAPPIPLTLPDGATRRRINDRVVVTLPERHGASGRGILTLREVPGGAVETVVPELVAHDSLRVLESALATIGGAEVVHVRADGDLVENVTGPGSGTFRFSFEGSTYLATARYDE